MPKKFIRQKSFRHLKIGKHRKKYRVWRKPKGRDSKMRLKRRSYPASPTVGDRSPKISRGRINDKFPILIYNLRDLESLKKENIPIIARIGKKKRIEIIKFAKEHSIKIFNVREKKNETSK